MNWNEQLIITWIIIWIIVWYLISKVIFFAKVRWHRKDAVQRSKDVVMWQVNEKIAPILPWFPYNYKDLVFIWKWIDYVVFDWLSTWNLRQVVFLEIKSWNSILNRNELMIKECLDRKKVHYETIRITK